MDQALLSSIQQSDQFGLLTLSDSYLYAKAQASKSLQNLLKNRIRKLYRLSLSLSTPSSMLWKPVWETNTKSS